MKEMRLLTVCLLLGSASAIVFNDLTLTFGQAPLIRLTCSCGWRNRIRIVGGEETKANEFPFMASLIEDGKPFCGGTIITNRHILTAAHCFPANEIDINKVQVAVGAHDLTRAREWNRRLMKIQDVKIHERYKEGGYEFNDIAIVVLAMPIMMSNVVGPICLPDRDLSLDNQVVTVLGWGLMADNATETAPRLRMVDLRVLARGRCEEAWGDKLMHGNITQICTWARDKDSCQADSGGPVILLDPQTNRYVEVGLVSYGGTCGGEEPGVNTNVRFFMPWIRRTVAATGPSSSICTAERPNNFERLHTSIFGANSFWGNF